MSTICVKIDGRDRIVPRDAYEKAKLKQIREFGYTSLTLSEVEKEVSACLDGKTLKNGLTVIGGFMEREVTPGSERPKPKTGGSK